MAASIRTIAKVAETSVSSVSRVLNNSGYVSPEVRQRVEAAIKDLNYAPSKGARMLRGEASRMIGLMLPSIDVPFFGILANTIERELFERGYHTLICSSAENEDHEARYVAMLRAQRVEGVIVASAYGGTAHLQPLVGSGIPVIAIDRELVGISDDTVMADHVEGGRMMTRHLLDLGHQRIAVVGAPGHSQPIRLRMEGIRAVLREHGLAPAIEAIGEEHSFAATYALAQSVLLDHTDITAIIGTTDIAAIAAIHAVRDTGRSVPDDCSVIGFDDLPEAAYVLPRLTTVAQPIRAVALEATRKLEERLQDHRQNLERRPASLTRMPVELIIRESTGPASADR
jgi:LacI family transcriptional regulator